MQAPFHNSKKTRHSFLSAKESNSNIYSILLVESTYPLILNDVAILRNGIFFPFREVSSSWTSYIQREYWGLLGCSPTN